MSDNMSPLSEPVLDTNRSSKRKFIRFLVLGGILIPLFYVLTSWEFVWEFDIHQSQDFEISNTNSIDPYMDYAFGDIQHRLGFWGRSQLLYIRILYECQNSSCSISHALFEIGTQPHVTIPPVVDYETLTSYAFEVQSSRLHINTMTPNPGTPQSPPNAVKDVLIDMSNVMDFSRNHAQDFINQHESYTWSISWGSVLDWNWLVNLYTDGGGNKFCVVMDGEQPQLQELLWGGGC